MEASGWIFAWLGLPLMMLFLLPTISDKKQMQSSSTPLTTWVLFRVKEESPAKFWKTGTQISSIMCLYAVEEEDFFLEWVAIWARWALKPKWLAFNL